MRHIELDNTVQIIKNLNINGDKPATSIKELPELTEYKNFNDLKEKIDRKELLISIPDFKLFGAHDFVVPKKDKTLSQIILLAPYIMAIIFSIYGMFNHNFWLLITLPISFLSPLFYSIFNKIIVIGILFIVSGYLIYDEKTIIGIFIFMILFSTLSSKLLKGLRRKTLIQISTSYETIFAFLFHNRTIAMTDTYTNEFIYSK